MGGRGKGESREEESREGRRKDEQRKREGGRRNEAQNEVHEHCVAGLIHMTLFVYTYCRLW